MTDLEEIKDSVEDIMFNKKNVVAVGLGQKWSNGFNTGEDAILVFVGQKKHNYQLSPSDMIPSAVEGVKTDVVGRSGMMRKFANTGIVRPLVPGYSCGHIRVTAGTIGAFFRDKDGEVVGLSNNHVLANTNNAYAKRHITLQPGIYDDGHWIQNCCGTLWAFQKLVGSGETVRDYHNNRDLNGYNAEDSAIFRLGNDYFNVNPDYDSVIPGIGTIDGWNDNPAVGDLVQKVGRTTGYTKANLIATSLTARVYYDKYTSFLFKDQLAANAMSTGGDSGSLVLDMNNNAVGLLYAGSSSITLMNRIKYPRAAYGLELIDGVQINETIDYQITSNGQPVSNTYGINDFDAAIKEAKTLARDGKNARIIVDYQAAPEV